MLPFGTGLKPGLSENNGSGDSLAINRYPSLFNSRCV